MQSHDEFEESLQKHFESLTGKFKHFCNDWDGLPVDETCQEFLACSCFEETEEVKQIKVNLRAEKPNCCWYAS